MRKKTMSYRLAVLAAAAAMVVTMGLAGGGSREIRAADNAVAGNGNGESQSFRGITKPSKDVILSFQHTGRVAEVLVQLGDEVKEKQLVAREDDTVELATLKVDKADAEDMTEEIAETKNLDKDLVDQQKMHDIKAASDMEKREADLKVEIDRARIELARAKRIKAGYKLIGTAADIERMKSFSPIDGVVAQLMLHPGESADGGNMKVMRIVQLDPLWVEVPVSILQARKLKKDDPAQVEFTDKVVRQGKVALVFPTGDSASGTITVRVEVKNPEKISSGENVNVSFGGATPVAKP